MFGWSKVYNVNDYQSIANFDWNSCQGRSYAEIDRDLNKEKQIFYGLNDKILAPWVTMIISLFGALLSSAIIIYIEACVPGGIGGVHKVHAVTLCVFSATGAVVAGVASLILCHRYHHKLTKKEAVALEKKWKRELQAKVVHAEEVEKFESRGRGTNKDFIQRFKAPFLVV